MLWRSITRHARREGKQIDWLAVTSPHYLPMLKYIPGDLKTVYYASDDYRSYEGWGSVVDHEKELIDRVDHTFFVSEGLLERAQKEYGSDPKKLSVSMNATESRFFSSEKRSPVDPPFDDLKRPVVGVVGGINDRLDFELLRRCADLPRLGTLLLVGPLPRQRSDQLETLLQHDKCVAVGAQPHALIHTWFHCLDLGLIPYVRSEFNRLCSPMRLFDHLASSAALVATDACDQVNAFGDRVAVCSSADDFIQAVDARLEDMRIEDPSTKITWTDRAEQLLRVLEETTHV